MKKVIRCRLDPYSIDAAIKELNAYKADLERRVRLLVGKLTDRGVLIAKAKVVQHGIVYDAELTNSIHGYVSPSLGAGFIRVDDEHAVFFEFGTGPAGGAHPHPSGQGNYRQSAWYTRADGKPMDDLYGWTPLVDADGNVYYLTTGQRSKPFMYDTAQKLKEEFPRIVREVFG